LCKYEVVISVEQFLKRANIHLHPFACVIGSKFWQQKKWEMLCYRLLMIYLWCLYKVIPLSRQLQQLLSFTTGFYMVSFMQ